jgi:very-short-patch-repair endonuclease
MTASHIDQAVAAIARRQQGVFGHRQVLDAGGTRRMIGRRLADKRWLELDHWVYALPSHPATWLRQVKAAELRFDRGAISGRASAVLYGLADLRPGSIEVTVPRGAGRTSRLARVRQRDGIATTTIAGIRVVTVGQTLSDLAAVGDPLLLERSVDDALLRHQITPQGLVDQHGLMVVRRWRGAEALGSLAEERANGYVPPTNELEAALYRVCDHQALPEYVRQASAPWSPGGPERVDVLFPTLHRIVEGDGRLWHARYRDFERDKRRDHAAQARGIEVTRFTYRQLVHESDYVLGVLLAIAAARRAA